MDKPPLLLVPGAFSGGWIWDETFAPWFRAHGYAVSSLTFPRHETGRWLRQRFSLNDSIRWLTDEIAAQPRPPIVVAHSLGGLMSLEAARTAPCAAIALLAPAPGDGVWRGLLGLGRKSPLSLLKLMALAVDERVTRVASPPLGIFSDSSDEHLAQRASRLLQAESLRTLAACFWRPGRAGQRLAGNPALHFWGAAGDDLIPAREVRRMAGLYDAPVTIYDGMGHLLQAEQRWPDIAADIHHWLQGQTRSLMPTA